MKLLAISGSCRSASTNSILLRAIQHCAPAELQIELFTGIGLLPIFNPDLEGSDTPETVLDFCASIDNADGLLIASPEYVRAIPGGLKNAIDWLVSRDEIMFKPVALAHASHRGDDMLASMRAVLSTVTERFAENVFLRIPLNSTNPPTEDAVLADAENKRHVDQFLWEFKHYINPAQRGS